MLLSRYQSLLGASEEAARKALSVSSAPKPSPTEDPAADPEVAKIRYIDHSQRKEGPLVCERVAEAVPMRPWQCR